MRKGNNPALCLLSLIYGLITAVRNFLYDKGIIPSRKFEIPVICVGNITVGGTGKTPHTMYLVSLLRKDYRVAVLSRGYRRRSRGFQIVTPQSSVTRAGDEPLQTACRFPDILVAVDRKRVHGVEMITRLFPATEVIILDDAFQHRRITPGFSILLTDFNRLMTRDRMLPSGNLRESIGNKSRADIIIVSKTPHDITAEEQKLITGEIAPLQKQKLFFTGLTYPGPVPLSEASPPFNFDDDKAAGILLVTGIADPSYLLSHIEKLTNELVHMRYPDHYSFTSGDLERIMKSYAEMKSPVRIILTTEKDAVRLREFVNIAVTAGAPVYYQPVEVCFLNDGKSEFDKLITEYAGRNKRNVRVPQVKGDY